MRRSVPESAVSAATDANRATRVRASTSSESLHPKLRVTQAVSASRDYLVHHHHMLLRHHHRVLQLHLLMCHHHRVLQLHLLLCNQHRVLQLHLLLCHHHRVLQLRVAQREP